VAKGLKALLPQWLPYYESEHGRLGKDLRSRVLSISAAQVDRLLAARKCRVGHRGRCGTKPRGLLKTQIPIRTDNWDITRPGFLEADTVAHCGGSLEGNFVWSVTFCDIYSVYPDRLRIWNPGSLPPDWSMEKLLGNHASAPANPDVAHAFFLAGKIESWGRGIALIRNECAGYPAPEFRQDHGGLWVEFPFPSGFGEASEAPRAGEEGSGETTQKTTQKILEVLRASPGVGRSEIASLLGNITENGVKYHLNKLKAEGRIRRVGPDKGGHWQVLS
jgi:hypothetical protein